jgi:hypothetical protein
MVVEIRRGNYLGEIDNEKILYGVYPIHRMISASPSVFAFASKSASKTKIRCYGEA